MRINAYIARATGLSRRQADILISQGRVFIGDSLAELGSTVEIDDLVKLDGQTIKLKPVQTVIINKPVGYVVSRRRQGAKTIYDLLPNYLSNLKPIGRLDKNSSGLLLLTNDGAIAESLTHPSKNKNKVYQVRVDKPIEINHIAELEQGVMLDDGISKLSISNLKPDKESMTVIISEGRNRQIRRSFLALGYNVSSLHRIEFAGYQLNGLQPGKWKII